MWISSIFGAARNGKGRCQAEKAVRPGILVITVDDRLYYWLFSISIDIGWSIRRARTVEEAREDFSSRPMPVVVYDERLPRADWRNGLRRLSAFPEHPAVLLAVPEVDEDLWQTVLRCQGYDVVKRSAGGNEWMQMLRFAWLSKEERAGRPHNGNPAPCAVAPSA
jgi:DNA-binding response OmpR family regulator